MSRLLSMSVVFLALTGLALAQVPPPAAPPAGRGGFAPIVIGPSAPVPPEVAIPRPTPAEVGAGQRRGDEVDRLGRVVGQTAASEFESLLMLQPPRLNVAATYTQTQQRMGPRHVGLRRDREERQYRSPVSRRLDHRLVGAGRRQQGDVRQVFRRYEDGQLRHRRRYHARSSLGPEERRRPGIPAEGRHADDRHQQYRRYDYAGTRRAGNRRGRRRGRAGDAEGLSRRQDSAARHLPASMPGDPVRDKIAEVNKIISKLDDQRHVFYMDIGAKFLDERGFFLPDAFRRRQPAPAGQRLRHLGRRGEGQTRGIDEVTLFLRTPREF